MASPEQLFRRFLASADTRALAAVFDALAPELLLVAAHVATGGSSAEDLVQATFLDAIENAPRWDATRPLLPWLIGILVHHAQRERRRRRRKVDAARLPQPAEPSPLDALASTEAVELVTRSLQSLPRPLRQVLVLRLVQGMTPTAIAHSLGCPVATVKTRLQRGLAWLRKALPAGIASSVAALVVTGRGLAAVRHEVLAQAGARGSVLAVGGLVGGILAGVAMKKLITGLLALAVCAALFCMSLRPPGDRDTPPRTMADAGASERGDLAASRAGPPVESSANVRVPAAADAKASPGSAALQFVWKGTDLVAPHLQVWWQKERDESAGRLHRCYADVEGRLRLADLPAGEYEVSRFGRLASLTIAAGRETSRRIEVEPSVCVDGVVVDEHGRGVGGARVWVQGFQVSEDTHPRLAASTNGDGTFRVRTERGGSCWAQKPGYVASRLHELEFDFVGIMRLVLTSRGAGLRGTVLTAAGAAAAGASVTIVRTELRDQIAAPLLTTADASGHFATDELEPGEHLLVATASDHAPTALPFTVTVGEEQDLVVRLGGGATLFGSVRAMDGTSLFAMIQVELSLAGAGAAAIPALRPIRQAFRRMVVCKLGDFRLDGVTAGAVVVTVTSNAAIPVRRVLSLGEHEQQRCDVVLERVHELVGRVVDADGAPLANWNVEARAPDQASPAFARTGSDGGFALAGIVGDVCQVIARGSGDGRSMLPILVDGVPCDGGEVVLRAVAATDGGWFTGGFVLPVGQPPPRFTVWASPVGFSGEGADTCQVRDPSHFELGPLPPGIYDLEVRARDQPPINLGRHEVALRTKVDLGKLSLLDVAEKARK